MADKKKSSSELLLENEELKLRLAAKEALIETFRESEKKYTSVYNSMSEGLAIHELLYDASGKSVDYQITDVNPAYEQIIGVKKKKVVGRKATDVYKVSTAPYLDIYSKVALNGDPQTFETFFPPMNKHFHVSVFSPEKEKFVTIFQDITERKQTEEALRKGEDQFKTVAKRYDTLFENTLNGMAHCKIITDGKGKPVDYVILQINDAYERIIGIKKADIEGRKVTEVFPDIRNYAVDYIGMYGKVALENGEIKFEEFFEASQQYLSIYAYCPAPGEFIAIFTDITDRISAMNALESQSAWLDASISSMVVGIILYGLDGKAIRMNEAAKRLLPEELIFNMSIEERAKILNWETEDGKPFPVEEIPLYRAMHGETTKMVVLVACFSDHKTFLSVNAAPIVDSNGKMLGVVASFLDITESKKNELSLHESEERYHQMFSRHQAIGLLIEPETGAIIDANPAAVKYYGYPYEQLCSLYIQDINQLPPAEVESERKRAFKEQRNYFIFPHRLASGEMRWVEVYSSPLSSNGRQLLYSIIHDITARKNAEESMAFQSQLLSDVHDAVFSSDINFTITYWNKAAEKMFGWTSEEVLGKNSGELLKPKVEGSTRNQERSKLRDAGHWEGEVQYIRKDGKYFFLDVNSTALKNAIGDDIGNVVVARDITERKQTEEKLKNSEERLRVTLTSIGDAVITFDASGKVNFLNPVAVKLTGWEYGQAAGQPVKKVFRIINEISQMPSEDIVQRVLEEGRVIGLSNHTALITKDGRQIPIEDSAAPIKDPSGKVIGVIIVFHDVTEKRQAQEALRKSEERFRNLVKDAPTAIYEIDFTTRKFTDVNDSMCKLSGYTREELLSIDSLELLDDESRNMFLSRISKSLKGEKPEENVEYKVKAKDGRMIDAVLNMKFNFNDKGMPVGAMVVGHDITQRKQVERELLSASEAFKESEKRFRTLAENIPDMIVRFDKDLRLLYGNEAVTKRTGRTLEFLTGKTAKEYGASSESDLNWQKAAKESMNTGKPFRLVQENTWQGVLKIYDALIVPERDENGQVNSIISIARDVTEMKKAENTLRVSEQRLKYHFENSPLAIVEWDKDFNIIRWSNEAERIFGYPREEAIGVRIDMLNIIHPEDIPIVEKTISRLTSGKEFKVVNQNRNLTKKGNVLDCIWYNSVLIDEKGETSSVMSLVEDVTLLRRTEKELIESRETYKELVTNARSMILKFDNEARFTFINEFACEFFGYKEEELLGESVMMMVPEQESTGRDLNEMVDKIIEEPDTYSININENIKRNGERVWVEWRNKTLYDEKGNKNGHIAIGIDVTERRKAEEALKESERTLKSVLDAANESIYMFDNEGHILMSNATGIRRLKKTEENEVIGHSFTEFMTPDLAKTRMKKINEVFNSGMELQYDDERNSRFFHHSFYPVKKDNEVLFVVTYSTDITERRNAEEYLKQSEDRFRTIAESLTVIVSITKISDSTLTFLNEPFERSFGYKKAEILGTRMPDIYFYPDDNKFLIDSLKVKGLVENVEVRVKKKNGKPFWIMTSIRKIDYMNEPSYLTASIDISETKRAQEELLRLNRTLDAQSKSSQAMMHSRNEQEYLNEICKIIIEDCGHAMVWVGYAQNDKQKSVRPVAHFGFDKGYIERMNISWDDSERGNGPTGTAIKTGKPSICKNMQTDPCFGPWRDAAIQRGYASSVVLPLKSEEKAFGAISIYSKENDPFTDSEIDLLSELADDLAYGVLFIRLSEYEKEATRSIKENETRLKELIATKDKFFNIIAHDLKNPFTSLLGASELLYDNISQMTEENIKKLALILNDSAKGGYAILQNLLDWSRSQTGQLKFNPEKVNLKSTIDENVENLKLQVNNKEIDLKSDLNEDLIILADKNMINTVLRNLLSNAVKYTFKNGTIRVMVEQSSNFITVTVKDTGIGISKEKADSLFKLENSLSLPGTAKEQGTGLGLKLCKEFTEKMGGKIWVDSKIGEGSEFKFTVPVKA